MGKSTSPSRSRKWGDLFYRQHPLHRSASDGISDGSLSQPPSSLSLSSLPPPSPLPPPQPRPSPPPQFLPGRRFISYWMLPLFSGLVWFSMLLGMLLYWTINDHGAHLPSMSSNGSIAFISDIGAFKLKPLFIAGSAITAVTFDLSFVAERWLRHNGRLLPNGSFTEKLFSALTIVFALGGLIGLICLTCFDTWLHHDEHDAFLIIFIVGYLASAVSTCWEYQRLGIKNRHHPFLRISFWVKLAFVVVEFVLVVIFGSLSAAHLQNAAAVCEWIVAFIFTFYILSFVVDLWPAVHTKDPAARFEKPGFAVNPAMAAGSDSTLEHPDHVTIDDIP